MTLHISTQSLERSLQSSAAMIPIAREIWEGKYRFTPAGGAQEAFVEESWMRIARAVAAAENGDGLQACWEGSFFDFRSIGYLPPVNGQEGV